MAQLRQVRRLRKQREGDWSGRHMAYSEWGVPDAAHADMRAITASLWRSIQQLVVCQALVLLAFVRLVWRLWRGDWQSLFGAGVAVALALGVQSLALKDTREWHAYQEAQLEQYASTAFFGATITKTYTLDIAYAWQKRFYSARKAFFPSVQTDCERIKKGLHHIQADPALSRLTGPVSFLYKEKHQDLICNFQTQYVLVHLGGVSEKTPHV